MNNELDVINFMASIQDKYFPELKNQDISFDVVYDHSFEGVMGCALYGKSPKVMLHYSDNRILEPRYRMGLVPVIAHELAHFLNPIDPESIMRDRLPALMMTLWDELLKSGYAECSMRSPKPADTSTEGPPLFMTGE